MEVQSDVGVTVSGQSFFSFCSGIQRLLSQPSQGVKTKISQTEWLKQHFLSQRSRGQESEIRELATLRSGKSSFPGCRGLTDCSHIAKKKKERAISGPFMCMCMLSHIQLFVTPRTIACQALLSMGFSRQECWSGLPCPPPGDLPNPRD